MGTPTNSSRNEALRRELSLPGQGWELARAGWIKAMYLMVGAATDGKAWQEDWAERVRELDGR